jgi:hypothetical protein
MARHSDIRIFLGKTFPLTTVGDNVQFIKLMLKTAELITEENKNASFTYNSLPFLVTKVSQTKIVLNDDGLFQTQDLNKALNEFSRLEDTYGNIPYTDLFFGEGSYPETLYFTENSKALLNAKIYASVMKRVYNWFRFGSDNPIYINHHAAQKLIASVMIDTITYVKGEPVIGFNIIQNDAIIHSTKVNLPFFIKTEALVNKYTPKITCLNEVKTLVNQIKNNGSGTITLNMVEKVAGCLLARQDSKTEIRVTLQTKDRAIKLVGINDPQLGGVKFIETNNKTMDAITLNEDRILIGTLINGLALLRQEYGNDYQEMSGHNVETIEITPDVFSSSFFIGKTCYQDIVDNIKGRVAKGQLTFSNFDEKGVRVRCVSWTNGKPYYSIECVAGDNIFIFDHFFVLNGLINSSKDNVVVLESPTVSLVSRIKQTWFKMFA